MTNDITILESKVEMIPECGCWIWTGSTGTGGYGTLRFNGKTMKAHRVSWALHNGNLPKELDVLHRCDTPSCVNPKHLFLGTALDNMRDAIKKGRFKSNAGINNPRAKLTAQQVIDIRADSRSQRSIAHTYSISKAMVYNIQKRIAWKDI